jgi:hypothetical protein
LAGIVKNRLIGRLTETLRSQSDGDISPTSSALYIGWIKGSACTSRHIFLKKEEWKTEKKKGRWKEKMECCARKTLREITRIMLKASNKMRSREHTII